MEEQERSEERTRESAVVTGTFERQAYSACTFGGMLGEHLVPNKGIQCLSSTKHLALIL